MSTTEEPTVAPEGTPEDADAIRERGKDLELVTKRGLHTGTPAYEEFHPAMRKLIKDSLLPPEATETDLYYLLELSATYRLDPFAREIWAVKMPGRNAAQGGYLTIMVGRDGMLAIAERHPDYRGYRCQAYYEHDTVIFHDEPRKRPDGTYTQVEHSFTLNADRGALLGAWAEVYREGRPPVFFDAKLGEYDKSDSDYSPWKKQKTVMIEKCALVTALRHTFRISGLYIADEMTNAMLAPAKAVDDLTANDGWNWGEDQQVKARLIDLFAALGNDRYAQAKQKLVLAGLGKEGRLELIAQLEQECHEFGIDLPPAREVGPDEEVIPENETEVEEPVVEDPEVARIAKEVFADADAKAPEPGEQSKLV